MTTFDASTEICIGNALGISGDRYRIPSSHVSRLFASRKLGHYAKQRRCWLARYVEMRHVFLISQWQEADMRLQSDIDALAAI